MANSSTFDSVSYAAVPDETPGDGTMPEYDEIIDQEREPSKANYSLTPAKVQPDSNHYCSTVTPQPPESNHECTIVSLVSVYQVFSQEMQDER